MGSSGSGKSTLLRMLAGMESPNQGKIILDGQDITKLAPYERPINMMFQSYALFPHMTVEQNIAFGLKQDKLPKAEIVSRVNEMLGLVHMQEFAKRKPHQLSGGQQARVNVARALMNEPEVLLVDEPTAALDQKSAGAVTRLIMDVTRKMGVATLYITHDLGQLHGADRIVEMVDGKLQASDAGLVATR